MLSNSVKVSQRYAKPLISLEVMSSDWQSPANPSSSTHGGVELAVKRARGGAATRDRVRCAMGIRTGKSDGESGGSRVGIMATLGGGSIATIVDGSIAAIGDGSIATLGEASPQR